MPHIYIPNLGFSTQSKWLKGKGVLVPQTEKSSASSVPALAFPEPAKKPNLLARKTNIKFTL